MKNPYGSMATKYKGTSQLIIDEEYNLKGLNLVATDQQMPQGESPNTNNSRMYAKNDGDSRVSNRTRKGTSRFSTPVGETLNVQNTASAVNTVEFDEATWVAQPFTPSSSGLLTKFEVDIKKNAGTTGIALVDFYTSNGSAPGSLIARTSIKTADITTSFQYLASYLIDAPAVANGTQYWAVFRKQGDGQGKYVLNLADAAGAIVSTDNGQTFTALNDSVRFKSYISTSGKPKGWCRWNPLDGNRRTIIAQNSNVYQIPDNTGTPASISSGLHANSSKVRFQDFNDELYWVDGFNVCRKWDKTTTTDLTNSPLAPSHIIAHQNRMFFVTDGTRVVFSELNDPTSYPSVNFFYVPHPKSSDPIKGWRILSDNLVILTGETKHIIYGSDLSTFQRREVRGTKGAVSDEAIAVDRNYIYFMSDDKQIYRFNGATDELISEKVEPELSGITDVSRVRLSIYNNQLRVYYAKSPSTDPDRMLLFDLVYQQWFRDTGRPVEGSMEWNLDNNRLIEISSKVGAAYYAEENYSDLGKPIAWNYWTMYKYYTSAAAKDRIKRVRPVIRAVTAAYTMLIGKDIRD